MDERLKYSITDVSKMIDAPQPTIRDWEKRLGLTIVQLRGKGRRYTDDDVKLLSEVKELRRKGIEFDAIEREFLKSGTLQQQEQNAIAVATLKEITPSDMIEILKREIAIEVKEVIKTEIDTLKTELEKERQINIELREEIKSSNNKTDEMLQIWREKYNKEQATKKSFWDFFKK